MFLKFEFLLRAVNKVYFECYLIYVLLKTQLKKKGLLKLYNRKNIISTRSVEIVQNELLFHFNSLLLCATNISIEKEWTRAFLFTAMYYSFIDGFGFIFYMFANKKIFYSDSVIHIYIRSILFCIVKICLSEEFPHLSLKQCRGV